MIIWVASYPRSGNTFFRMLLEQVYGINTYSVYEVLSENVNGAVDDTDHQTLSDITAIDETHSIYRTTDALPTNELSADRMGDYAFRIMLDEMAEAKQYYFLKTHELPKEDYPAIYLVRDGRDVLVSHARYILNYDQGLPSQANDDPYLDVLRDLIRTNDNFGGWGNNVLAWMQRATPTVIIKYEDLIKAPLQTFKQALQAVGYSAPELSSYEIPEFAALNKQDPIFFRKGRAGTWREEMPPDLHELFWSRYHEAMNKMGYSHG